MTDQGLLNRPCYRVSRNLLRLRLLSSHLFRDFRRARRKHWKSVEYKSSFSSYFSLWDRLSARLLWLFRTLRAIPRTRLNPCRINVLVHHHFRRIWFFRHHLFVGILWDYIRLSLFRSFGSFRIYGPLLRISLIHKVPFQRFPKQLEKVRLRMRPTPRVSNLERLLTHQILRLFSYELKKRQNRNTIFIVF